LLDLIRAESDTVLAERLNDSAIPVRSAKNVIAGLPLHTIANQVVLEKAIVMIVPRGAHCDCGLRLSENVSMKRALAGSKFRLE
jgi:hypothetical protein